ncbi:hypothetical protein MKW94_026527 [Papaver nudicaule]|uniref:Uncharacterized protein n=1 Tax=Papaver nudicaule TaxID=74823 RepID=A0AA41SPE9_PAPNU|nr:hypothetical protein [Papaver nudicaule]
MQNGSSSDGNVCFSNCDRGSYAECPIEPDDDVPDYDTERAKLETDTEIDFDSSVNLLMNITRVYMFSKKIIGDMGTFHVCKPHMKLDICIHWVESDLPSCKNDQWMREIKRLSFALSTSDENPNIQYSQIGACFTKLTARNSRLKKLLDGLFRMIINPKPFMEKIKSEGRQKSRKHA